MDNLTKYMQLYIEYLKMNMYKSMGWGGSPKTLHLLQFIYELTIPTSAQIFTLR